MAPPTFACARRAATGAVAHPVDAARRAWALSGSWRGTTAISAGAAIAETARLGDRGDLRVGAQPRAT